MAVRRWPQTASLILAGVVLAAPVVGLSVVYHSGVDAIRQSVQSEFGYSDGWKLQASKTATEAVAATPHVTAVRVSTATVAAASARTDALHWSLDNGEAPVGHLLVGRRAEARGEASISRHLAESLAVEPGASVSVSQGGSDSAQFRIVGVISDPANRDADLVISVGGPNVEAQDATYWIAAYVPPQLDITPGLTASGVTGATQARLEHPPRGLFALGRAIPIVGFLAVLVTFAAVAAQVPGARRDIFALREAGMSSARSLRIITTWIAISVSIGSALGALVTVALLSGTADRLAAMFGQRWTGISLPLLPLVLVVSLPLLISFAPVHILDALLAWFRREDTRTRETRLLALVGGGALFGLGLMLAILGVMGTRERVDTPHPEIVGLLGILALALGTYFAFNELVGIRLGSASGQLARQFAGQLTIGTTAALVLGGACAGYSAWHAHNSHALESVAIVPQESGSFLVYQAPASAARNILSRYRTYGGERAFVYDLPDETQSSLRVTNTAVVECLEDGRASRELLGSCLQNQNGTMGFPALDDTLPSGSVLVEPTLVEAVSSVGIVEFGSDGLTISESETTVGTATEGLGGNMPSVVTSPEGALAKKYNLRPSGLVEFGMLDFGRLSAREAAHMRSLVANFAPAAQSNDTTVGAAEAQGFAISTLVALVGAAVAFTVQLAAGMAVFNGSRQARMAVSAVGGARLRRAMLGLRVIGPAVLGLLVTGVAVAIVAPRLGYVAAMRIGWAWSVPLFAQLVVLVGLGGVLLRAPRQ